MPNSKFHIPYSGSRGFGLAETVVAIGLFSVIVSIAVGGFSRALRSQRQAAALLLANSNVSITLEQMTREMRTGYDFCRSGNLCPSLQEVGFTNARAENISYRLRDGGVERRAGLLGDYQKITAEGVLVRHLDFYVNGEEAYASGDRKQPRVTIAIGISSRDADLGGNIVNLQTTVSPRLPLDT